MKILFDLQGLQNESRNRGIGRYVRSLFDALAARSDIELYGLLNGSMAATFDDAAGHVAEQIRPERLLVFPGLAATRLEQTENAQRSQLAKIAYEAFVAESGCDVLFAGTIFDGFIDGTTVSLSAPEARYAKAAILYDLIPLIDEEKYLSWDKARNWYFECVSHLESSDIIFSISESSRQEGIQYLGFPPESITNISSAISQDKFNRDVAINKNLLARLGIAKPFVMHTSAIEPRKNFDGLIRAFASLPARVRDRHQLVLVGGASDEARDGLLDVARKHGLSEKSVVIPGFVPDDELASLYRSCSLFVFPSFHEGFGLPALEAMSCGCPTIGSSTTSIPEVIGKAAYTFDPADDAAMAKLMLSLLSDKDARRNAVAHAKEQSAAFSWEKVADRVVSTLKRHMASRTGQTSTYPSAARMARHVSNRLDLANFAADDVARLAHCLAQSEDELVSKLAAGHPKDKKTWRIEGPFDSSYSLALVNRETARALSEAGWQVALHSTEGPGDFPANPEFLAANPDLERMHSRAEKTASGKAHAVSRLLYPPRVSDMQGSIKALHHYAWEESGFPREWVEQFNNSLTMMTALSTHVEKIMVDNGVSVPMVTSGCGVDHWDRIVADKAYKVEGRGFRFLHVSSCFPRKGADSLLEAYGSAFTIHDDVSLIIKTFDNPHNEVRQKLDALRQHNPHFPDVILIFADLSDAELKALYEQCHVMVGPSFAEGYGLPFAEAMLSGIPVITTAWGGQLDFCNPGNSWLVDYEFERAQTHFGLWASAWARVDLPSLRAAMLDAYATDGATRAKMAARGREQLMRRHRWGKVAERLTAAAATLPAQQRRLPKIGWLTTWRSKCGIATYSQHLIAAMPCDAIVFAPRNEKKLVGQENSLRIWNQSKNESELWKVLIHPEYADLDTIVIQFNFGFFNHEDLSRFISYSKQSGKSIIITLHSTTNPQIVDDPANYHLEYIVDALRICDRVLVHSIDDLNRLKRLGLVDNVALFPHGVLRRAEPLPARAIGQIPVIGSYGFALPHKGLPELIEAVRILHDQGRPVMLHMVNAEYPIDLSANLIAELKALVDRLGLNDAVTMHTSFLKDEESLGLLTQTDLVVFPYQETAESASGAVRYGLAVERPVATTPLGIFSDVEGATFRLGGTAPADIAAGIAAALDALTNQSPLATQIAEQANRWRDQHNYAAVADRLFHMAKALAPLS